nr:DUF2256 domain-containing protein [Psychrobacter sp. JB385]
MKTWQKAYAHWQDFIREWTQTCNRYQHHLNSKSHLQWLIELTVINAIEDENYNYDLSEINLRQRTCPVCQRPFTWRKKWEKDWERVIYCSERYRRSKSKSD